MNGGKGDRLGDRVDGPEDESCGKVEALRAFLRTNGDRPSDEAPNAATSTDSNVEVEVSDATLELTRNAAGRGMPPALEEVGEDLVRVDGIGVPRWIFDGPEDESWDNVPEVAQAVEALRTLFETARPEGLTGDVARAAVVLDAALNFIVGGEPSSAAIAGMYRSLYPAASLAQFASVVAESLDGGAPALVDALVAAFPKERFGALSVDWLAETLSSLALYETYRKKGTFALSGLCARIAVRAGAFGIKRSQKEEHIRDTTSRIDDAIRDSKRSELDR